MEELFRAEADILVTHRQDPVRGYMAPDVQERSPHFHYQYEMLLIVSGRADFSVGGKLYHTEPGSMLVLSSMENHHVVSFEKGFDRYSLRLSAEALSASVRSAKLLSLFRQRPADFCHHYRCTPEEARRYADLFEAAAAEYARRRDCWDLRIGSMLQDILIGMYRTQPAFFPACRRGDVQQLIFEVQNYIETHVREELSLDTLADRYYVSKYYLSHCFTEVSGCSFRQYIVMARLSAAKQLLLTTDTDVAEVGTRTGFHSASHFIRLFRKYEGTTPLQYRARGRKAPEDGA